MIDYYSLPDDSLPMSMRVLREILRSRGYKIQKLYAEEPSNLVLTRPDGKILKITSSTPPTTSSYAIELAKDKMATYHFLKELDIPQPETKIINTAADAADLLEKYPEIVIKPVDGAHGRGITTGVKSLEEVEKAIDFAYQEQPNSRFIVAQEMLESQDVEIRAICINYEFTAAYARIPAAITGDGTHNVAELIDLENSTIRTEPYKSDLSYIKKESALKYLSGKTTPSGTPLLDYVPSAGEKIRVSDICNVGQGGTVEDLTDTVSEDFKRQAEKIARASELPVIGIDYYGDYVLELNSCPSLYMPLKDKASAVAKVAKYADYLDTL